MVCLMGQLWSAVPVESTVITRLPTTGYEYTGALFDTIYKYDVRVCTISRAVS